MTPDDRWLAAVWPFVQEQLPPPPAAVLEIGCGALGGFVPALRGAGHRVVGVDPDAPEGPDYRRVEFERCQPPWPVDGVVASLALHHVADLDQALDRLRDLLVPGGTLVTSGLVDKQMVRTMIDDDRRGAADRSKEIWQLLTLEVWYRQQDGEQ